MNILTFGEYAALSGGQLQFLTKAKQRGTLWVALKTDSIQKPFDARKAALLETGLVDFVLPAESANDLHALIRAHNIDQYVYGNPNNKIEAECDSAYLFSGILPVPFLVVCVGQACSLRCVSCGNFSPYAPRSAALYPMAGIIEDLRLLLANASVSTLQIQGGECFLHPDLADLVKFVIETDRVRSCEIATNGTLLPQVAPALLRNDKISLRISDYPLQAVKAQKLKAYCDERNIQNTVYSFLGGEGLWRNLGLPADEYAPVDDAALEDRFDACGFRICLTLENHRLGRCSRSVIAQELQGFTAREHDYLEINDRPGFADELAQYLRHPHSMEACRFCNGSVDAPLIPPALQC